MIYSKAENIYWVRTKDGKYLQFKDKIDYAKEGIEKEPIIKTPITNKGLWFVKTFRMMDEEILCKKIYGQHDAYFFEFTLTFYVP
ncbi:MAG: hypothetical protein ABDH16_02130 [Thermodesulfovibrionaceae bacterium]